jgi:hypothetical protein
MTAPKKPATVKRPAQPRKAKQAWPDDRRGSGRTQPGRCLHIVRRPR